ncbi:MAG TPA: polysaccharide deacetylase family protein [Bryobacteraceae bacterium]|nr:polysaccharide deacetylase family protein [Bryobacteraceae bacterium]
MKRKTLVVVAAGVAAIAALLFFVRPGRLLPTPYRPDPALEATLNSVLDDYRRIIVLMDGAESLDDATRARYANLGRILFWRKTSALEDARRKLSPGNNDGIRQLIQFLSSNPALHDADKLAFLDLVEELASSASRRHPLTDPLKGLLDNLQSIQLAYREEVTRIFSQFATRGAAARREKWSAYVADLRTRISRDKIVAELGDALPEEPPEGLRGAGGSTEVFGNDFTPKTVALTFDDGPHPKYTELILALLRKYGIRACFFELGTNLGTVENGEAKLSRNAEIAKKVLEAGHVIANHSFSHPVLSKLPELQRESEIDRTTLLLEKVAGRKPELFRAPYGARNQAILKEITADGLRSIMWNIDSLDWADPIPESIAMRVLHELNEKHRGIILFHDIHKQSVLALSPVIEELLRQEYTFLSFDKGQFVTTAKPPEPQRSIPAQPAGTETAAAPAPDAKPSFYRESWAVIIGINDYENWPKLRYAVNDANGIEEVLTTKFGFKHENVRKMLNGEATRQRIMQVLGDELSDGKKVQREDRVFFFFAGHGATRTLEDGRQIGFIVPVDASQSNYYSTAISMNSLREASDLIPAKHIYSVMDSCYSGLALTRGSGSFSRDRSYLEEVTRRAARQILTAGGADQEVADDGPNGHSVFTWALLQGLDGRADLDGNGFITASELGAYVSPVVSSFAKQTPAVGNLVGSEGGEFVFELQPQLLTSRSRQLDDKAMQLTGQLDALQQQIAARQAELLKLQQSIQAETARLAQVKQGEPAAAAPRAKPSSVKAYDLDRQGQQFYREKKYPEALQKFQAAVELKPGDPVLLNNLGFIYYVMGQYDDALNYLQKTLAVDPRRKEAHENIADTYMKLGRHAEAKEHYQQFLALAPGTSRSEEVRRILQSMN